MLMVIVQFLRSGLAVANKLIPRDSVVGFILTTPCHQSLLVGPLAEGLTYFEYAVGLTFLIPTLLYAYNGTNTLISGLTEYSKYRACKYSVDRLAGSYGGAEWTIVRHGIVKDIAGSTQKMVVGVGNLLFSACYVNFTMDAFGMQMEDHTRVVVNSILVSLIVLAYFIYLIWVKFSGEVVSKTRLQTLSKVLRRDECCNNLESFLTTVGSIGYLSGDMYDAFLALNPAHIPAWRQVNNAALAVGTELDTVKIFLTYLTNCDSEECKYTRLAVADCLEENASMYAKRTPLDLFYFMLNSLAGCGYAVGVAVFYLPASNIAPILTYMNISLPISALPFYGDLLGNVSWTLEPIVVALDAAYLPSEVKTVPHLKSRPELPVKDTAKETSIGSKSSGTTTVRRRVTKASK